MSQQSAKEQGQGSDQVVGNAADGAAAERHPLIQMLRAKPYAVQTRTLQPGVQLDGQSGAQTDTDVVHRAASHGIQGGGGNLPHLAAIQRSFGSHDVSGIQAHTGTAATQANEAMGAEAYATGNHVAFKGTPDLHTTAHEAAHVVQQRSGVSLPGGVGSVGDSYEQHADKVADAVVAGQSAESLLSEMSGGGASEGPVQMAQRGDQSTPGGTQVDLSADKVPKKTVTDADGEQKQVPVDKTTQASIDDPLKHPYFKTFEARVLKLFKSDKIATPSKPPAQIAKEIWLKVCEAAKAARPSMDDHAAYSNFAKRYVKMDTPQYEKAMSEFALVTQEISTFVNAQFKNAQSYGFWSTPSGKELSEDLCDVTLETSGLGGLFDDIPNLNGNTAGWNPGLWGSLSDSYASAVVGNWEKGKRIHVCVGPNARATGNIWDMVESKTLAKGLPAMGTTLKKATTYHGAAVTRTNSKKVDFRVGSTFRGAVYSGKDRAIAIEKATEYAESLKAAKGKK